MGLIAALRTRLAAAALREAAPAEAAGASGATIETDAGWRRLTGQDSRALSPMTRQRMRALALHLWRTNPLANRLVELPIAYLLAEGVSIACADEEAQGWLDAFWRDPINAMEVKLPQKARELALFGEQCWPAAVNALTGHVRLGYLDPGLIETVVQDPDNVEQPVGIITVKDARGRARGFRVIVNGPETAFSARTQRLRETFADGDCFFFTVNALSNAARGQSDLLAQLDWLDGYDQALFGELERWDFLRAFIYDVTLTGATPEQVAERARQIQTPRPGAVRVHNEAETWSTLSPSLGGADTTLIARLFRNHALGGGTIPEHWYGGGGEVNRATAGEMGEPTVKVFAMRQRQLGHILAEVGRFQIGARLRALYGSDIAQAADPSAYRVRARWPELTARDTAKFAASLAQTVGAAATAIDRGVMSTRSAVGLVALAAGQLGLEVDAEAELAAIRAEASDRAADPAPNAGAGYAAAAGFAGP